MKSRYILLLALVLSGCSAYQDPVILNTDSEIIHPSMPIPPSNPGVKVLILTTDTVEDQKAYVGFTYDEWLDFAKWMHEYKAYNHDLREVIKLYKNQDKSLNDENK